MNNEETVIISGRGNPPKSLLISGILLLCIIYGIIYIKYYFDHKKSEITVTNMRIKGITVRKQIVELPLDTVISAEIHKNGICEFLVVNIYYNNKSQKVVFSRMDNSVQICNAINNLVAARQGIVQPQIQQPVQPQMPQFVQPEVQQPVQPQMPQCAQPEVQQPVQPQMPQYMQPEVQQPVQPQIQQPVQSQTSQPVQQAPQSVADELKKFKELLDMGVITQQEFDDIKRQLLAQ